MKVVLGDAEVRYRKTGDVSVVMVEVMSPPGLEAQTYKALVQMLHGEKVVVSLAPEALADQASGILESA